MCQEIRLPFRQDEPFQTLENPIEGGKVVTRCTGPGRYVTAVHGGPLNGEMYRWESAIDARDNHYHTVALCRQAHRELVSG